MLDLLAVKPARSTHCARLVNGRLPDIPLLSLQRSEITLQRSRTLFRGRKVIVIGEFLPQHPGGYAESLLQDYSALGGMVQRANGIDHIYALSRSNPVDLARYGDSIGLSAANISYLTDPAGCFSSFLEAEGCLPVRASMSDSAAYAALLNNGEFEQLYIRRPRKDRCDTQDERCTTCPHVTADFSCH